MATTRVSRAFIRLSDPTTGDDATVGYRSGDVWIRVASGRAWMLAAPLAGTWVEIGGGGGGGGNTVLNGAGAPSSGTGDDGDFYIDTSAWDIYGPKAAGAWGSGTSLVGPGGGGGGNTYFPSGW